MNTWKGCSPEGAGGKAHRAADVHRISENIEREAFNAMVHEDAEVVAEEGTRDTECPGRRDDERLSNEEQHRGDELVIRLR